MMQAGEPRYTPATIERVMSCPATQAKLNKVRLTLEGKRIVKVQFTCEYNHIEIQIHLDDGEHVKVFMEELALMMLLRDSDIARQEQDLYYKSQIYRRTRRRKRKGDKADDEKT